MNRFLIIGGGFMGYSLALDIKFKLPNAEISILEIDLKNKRIIEDKSNDFDIYETLSSIEKSFDVVIICTPIKVVPELIKEVSNKFSDDTLITDISSSKNHLGSIATPKNFVSSHPICGSEKSGPDYADLGLYVGRTVAIIGSEDAIQTKLAKFWEILDMNVVFIDSDSHDRVFGDVSHLPHIIAKAYKESLAGKDIDSNLFADSGKELLRLGNANESLWKEIFADNNENIVQSLDNFEEALRAIKEQLK